MTQKTVEGGYVQEGQDFQWNRILEEKQMDVEKCLKCQPGNHGGEIRWVLNANKRMRENQFEAAHT